MTNKTDSQEKRNKNPLVDKLISRFGGELAEGGFWWPETGSTDFMLRLFSAPLTEVEKAILEIYTTQLKYVPRVTTERDSIGFGYAFEKEGYLASGTCTYSVVPHLLSFTCTVHDLRKMKW